MKIYIILILMLFLSWVSEAKGFATTAIDISKNVVQLGPVYNVIILVLILILTVIVATLINRLLRGYFRELSSKLNIEYTIYSVVRHFIIGLIYFLGVMLALSTIPQIKSFAVALVAGAGITGIIIGLAAQSTLSNVIAGFSLAISRPYRIGDVLSIMDEYGTVEDLTLRHTVIKTWENKRLIIPNGIINNEAIANWTITDLPVLWHEDFGIAYDADIELARSIILDEIDRHPDVMHERERSVIVLELADFSVKMRSVFWVRDRPKAWDVGCIVRESVKKRFDVEGIEIPYPYRTIVFKREMS